MDRPIDPRTIRARSMRRILLIAVALTAAVVALFMLRGCVQPSIHLSRVRTAAVERGPVEAATLCSGTVVAATEQIIPCPFTGRVLEVSERPGAQVVAGQILARLDDSEVRLEHQRLEDQIALLANRRRELDLDLERRVDELGGQIEIQAERLAFLETKTAQQRSLRDLGLSTVHELRQAELDEKIARIELRQLKESVLREREATETRIGGLGIEAELLQRDLDDQKHRLDSAQVRADSDGVLTWITDSEGGALTEGVELARVADLSRFRVEATVSDLHASRIAVGMAVRVVIDQHTLVGHVSSIPPAIDDGIMSLLVSLDRPDHPSLRANRRVDVHVITETRDQVLRVQKGPFVTGAGEQQVFVLHGDVAERTRVRVGVAGVDHLEILSGLYEHDTVIISSMKDHIHLDHIRIRGGQ